MDILIESSIDNDPELSGYLNNLDILKYFKGDDRKLLGDMVEALRSWGRYNTIMTDLSPFLTDAKTVIEGELAKEILDYAKQTGEFPVDMVEFMENQPEPLRYIWENSQKMRDLMTRATLRLVESENLDMDNKTINDAFKILSKKIYKSILTGPYLTRIQSKS